MADTKQTSGISIREMRLPALVDGLPLACTLVVPAQEPALAHHSEKLDSSHAPVAVVIGPATGVKRQFYLSFAKYLAENGIPALTLDLRGIGESRPADLSTDKARWEDWALRDMPAAIEFMQRTYPQHDIVLVGHSVGAHVLAKATDAATDTYQKVKRVVSVTAQIPYWRTYDFPKNARHCLYMLTPKIT
jgi:predicted alpha/beta hydrolase